MVEEYRPSRVSNRDVASYFIDGNLATAVAGIPIYVAPTTGRIVDVRAYAATAPTGATAIFDVNINGTTAFTTQANRPTIAISGNASTTTLPDVVNLSAGDVVSIGIDQVGSTVAGADAIIQVTVE